MKWRWSERVEGHIDFQCPHMAADPWWPDESMWHTLPLAPPTKGGWEIVTKEPLTIIPSIKLLKCGCHGFITNGIWVPC